MRYRPRLQPARRGGTPVEVVVDALALLFTLTAVGLLLGLARAMLRRRPRDNEEPQLVREPAIRERWARALRS